MAYTKQHSEENKQILARAKELLAGKIGIANEYPEVFSTLCREFPGVKTDRIWPKISKVLRWNRYQVRSNNENR